MKGILWIGGVATAIPVIIALLVPVVIRQQKAADRMEAVNNLKQVGVCLRKFEERYGRFPDDSTLPTIQVHDRTKLRLGTGTSNDYFRQLIATVTTSEKIFFANVSPRYFYPNDLIGPSALEKDECAFSYVPGHSSSSDPSTPIAMAPVVRGTSRFDPKPFGKRAVVLFADGSVKSLPIDESSQVQLNGMDIFDPGQSYWNGKAPNLKWPE